MRLRTGQRDRGFTLLEVLVALTIFAVTAVAIYSRVSDVGVQTARLEERTFATWIARNQMAELELEMRQLAGQPTLGDRRTEVRMAERDWLVEYTVTPDNTLDGLYRADLQVFVLDGRNERVAGSMRGYLALPE